MQLLHDNGIVAGKFDERILFGCKKDQVTHACRSLYEKSVPLTGGSKYESQDDMAIMDAPRIYHTGSSQYASAESEIESSECH